MIAEYGLGLKNEKKKPSFFGKTQFLSVSRYKAKDLLAGGFQTRDKDSCPRWRQHLTDVFRNLHTIFPLKVSYTLIVVTKLRDDI